MFDRAIVEDGLPRGQVADVAHYTRIGTLCHLLQPSDGAPGWTSAWATPVQFLNDRMELSLGLDVLAEVANRKPRSGARVRSTIELLRSSLGGLETDAFQMSFSGNPDELGQWRGYAANGMGCCVVTEVDELRAVADVAGWVIYNSRQQRGFAAEVLERLRKQTQDLYIRRVLVASASYMKHDGFEGEQEFRLLRFPNREDVHFRETGDRLVPYVDFLQERPDPLPIRRIVIGPGWQLASVDPDQLIRHHVVRGISRLLNARRLDDALIESSGLPYDPR